MAEQNINPESGQDQGQGIFSKAKELLDNLLHAEKEGSGLPGDPEAEAKLAEARESKTAEMEAIRAERAATIDASVEASGVVPKVEGTLHQLNSPEAAPSSAPESASDDPAESETDLPKAA